MKKDKDIDMQNKKTRKGLSEKEISLISELELNQTYFFNLSKITQYFKNENERNVYIHNLRKKGRIVKLNKQKYFLIPIKAVGNNWSEHPFIIIDEIMNGKNYCITGMAAANYWKLTDQIPQVFEVWNNRAHKRIKVLNTIIDFKKHKIADLPQGIKREIYSHKFVIAVKKEIQKWKSH